MQYSSASARGTPEGTPEERQTNGSGARMGSECCFLGMQCSSASARGTPEGTPEECRRHGWRRHSDTGMYSSDPQESPPVARKLERQPLGFVDLEDAHFAGFAFGVMKVNVHLGVWDTDAVFVEGILNAFH